MTSLLVLLCCVASAQLPNVYALRHEGVLADVAVADVTGDGRGDICALSMRETAGHEVWLSLYLARPDGSYPQTPDIRHALPLTTGGVFFAETDGAAPIEIVAVDHTGAYIFSLRDNALALIAEPRFFSLFPAGLLAPRFLEHHAVDITGDGIHEWLVPLPNGYALRSPEKEIAVINCHVDGSVAQTSGRRTQLNYGLPGVVPFDHAGAENGQALAFISSRTVEFVHGPDWDNVVTVPIPFRGTPPQNTHAHSGGYADTFPKPPQPQPHAELHDLNNNGRPDLIVTEAEGGLNVETHTRVYYAKPDHTFPEEPDIHFRKPGAYAQPTVIDVNGDGLNDIFFFELSFGIRSMVSYLVRRKVRLGFEAYLNSPEGFSSSPDLQTRFTVDVSDDERPGVLALGHFTGNGRMDAVFSQDGEKLGLFEGEANRLVAQRPTAEFDIPPFGVAKTCVLHENGREDLVVFEPGAEEPAYIYALVF